MANPLFRNFTPFSSLAFESWGPGGAAWRTVALKGTFALRPEEDVRGIPDQAPLMLAATHWGEPGQSSLRQDHDLAPFKPRTDVHVVGTARAPGGKPRSDWVAGVQVGPVDVMVRLVGPRTWTRRRLLPWRLSPPEPTVEVPLQFERSFGGVRADGRAFERNPYGTGWDPKPGKDSVLAPQIEAVDDPVSGMGNEVAVAALGPLAPVCSSRRALAGTFDDEWLEDQWPLMPDDFDFAFYNSAPESMQVDGYLQGDEAFELTGLLAEPSFRGRLPGIRPFVLARQDDGHFVYYRSELDTVVFSIDERLVYMTWRSVVPLEPEVRVLEARAAMNAEASHGS
ncbi:MAG: DUF2169 domain-containing protein [Planctomycetota bacterium]